MAKQKVLFEEEALLRTRRVWDQLPEEVRDRVCQLLAQLLVEYVVRIECEEAGDER